VSDARGARIVRLIEDPAVGGDLLLVALGMAAKYDFGLRYGTKLDGLAGMLWSTSQTSAFRIREALRRDARTYKPPESGGRLCTAPMIRRAGECGKSASASGYLTDWSTGEMRLAGGCGRHVSWFWDLSKANWAARPEAPPLPCANHGGALVSHFPRIDWRKFWRRLDSRWVEHPEVKPWPKPDLTLVLGDTGPERDDRSASTPLRALALVGPSVLPEEKP
jgi:hypothetical protein